MKKEITIGGVVYVPKENTTTKTVKMTIKEQNLEWGARSEKGMTWDEARKWCEKQGKDWRMPTRRELLEAYEQETDGFTANFYWSSTELSSNSAWYQSFSSGIQNTLFKLSNYYVRCIRSLDI